MPRGNTVTSTTYADLKNHVRPAIKSKRRGRLVQVFCSNKTMLGPILPVQLLQQSKICPLSVFHIRRYPHVFGPLKEAMGGKSFRSDEEVQQAVHEWLLSQPKEFFF